MISFSTLFAMQRYIDSNGEVNLNESLVAHYLLNNNADDCVGTFDGTANGGVDFKGDVASFDGSGGEINLGIFTLSNFKTFSFWVNNRVTQNTAVFSNRNGENQLIVGIEDTNYITVYSRIDNTIYISIFDSYEFPQNELKHITITADGTNANLYIDGVLKQSLPYAHYFNINSGGYTYICGNDAAGLWETDPDLNISNFRIYLDAKDQSFIYDLYAEGYYPKPLPLPTTDGLIAHYPLTGTAEDSTSNYDGTENDITYVDDSEFGSVSDFDGVDDYIELPTEISDNISTNFDCISFWFNVGYEVTGANENNEILSLSGTNGKIALGSTSGHLDDETLSINSNDGSDGYSFIKDVLPVGWRYVVVQWDGSNYIVYIDGTAKTMYFFGAQAKAKLSLLFGKRSTYYYSGQLRDIRIYNKTLIQQEITDIYNYEKNFRSIDIDNGLIAYYPLANNSSDNYYNEYNGTDTDMTYDSESASFNGTSSKVITPITALDNQTVTYSFWLKSNTDQSASLEVPFSFTVLSFVYSHSDDTTHGTIAIQDGAEIWHTAQPNSLSKNVDYHIVVTIDNTSAILKINGVDSGSITFDGTYNSSESTTLQFGKHYEDYFDGNISKVRIYNKALAPEQIKIIYDTENLDNH